MSTAIVVYHQHNHLGLKLVTNGCPDILTIYDLQSHADEIVLSNQWSFIRQRLEEEGIIKQHERRNRVTYCQLSDEVLNSPNFKKSLDAPIEIRKVPALRKRLYDQTR